MERTQRLNDVCFYFTVAYEIVVIMGFTPPPFFLSKSRHKSKACG